MSAESILLPAFVQVVLTFLVLLELGRRRLGALRRGDTRIPEVALGQPSWPEGALQCANNFRNQFEVPVLFYVLTGFVLITGTANSLFLFLAWIFVASRIAHAAVHISSNEVRTRFLIFVFGVTVLMLMWAAFAYSLYVG